MAGEIAAAVMQCSAVVAVGCLGDATAVHGHCCLFLAPLSAGGKSVHIVLHVYVFVGVPELSRGGDCRNSISFV